MADQEQVNLLQQGSETWNSWLKQQNTDIYLDLRGANLEGLNLSGTYLNDANLEMANLRRTSLILAFLQRANLRKADLGGADLSNANLSNANLYEADLSGTNLSGVNLRNADVNGARLWGTIFAYLDLQQTKGLSNLIHHASSRIELHTVLLPRTNSASEFLQGAGVPEKWITFYQEQTIDLCEYYSCFISCSSKDKILASRLRRDLQTNGVCCWLAEEDFKIGDKIRERIDQKIHEHDKLLLICSQHSITSYWVEDEVEAALEKERLQQREVLFPVCIDNAIMETSQAWAAKLRRQRHIGDFTRWTEPAEYQQVFDKLLHNLKKEKAEESHV